MLLVGPRGAGKTTLIRRIQAEVRLDSDLASEWIPVAFGEESYSITSAGEFWLESIYHLAKTIGSEDLERRYIELRDILDNGILATEALSTLVLKSREAGKKMLLLVENMDVLTDQQLSKAEAAELFRSLRDVPEIMLVATATTSFRENGERSDLFGNFLVKHIGPLSLKDSRLLWMKVSGGRLVERQARPVQILTGGNPRLIRVLAEFALDNVFVQLVNKLALMIDQYTDYFKGQIDILPAGERKIFVSLLELWDPALTRDVARASRVTTNTAGAYLDRLERRGAVVKREGRWQATERLFNIYYLMRRRGAPSSRVAALVRFMTVFYGPDQLETRVRELAAEACHLRPEERQDHYHAVSALMVQFAPGVRRRLISVMPEEFFKDPNLPAVLVRLLREVSAQPDRAGNADGRRNDEIAHLEGMLKHISEGDVVAAGRLAEEFIRVSNSSVTSLYSMAMACLAASKYDDAERWIRSALAVDDAHLPSWTFLVDLLLDLDRSDEAFKAAQQLVALDNRVASSWVYFARAAQGASQADEAVEDAFRRALELDPELPEALIALANIAVEKDEISEATKLFETAMTIEPVSLATMGQYGDFVDELLAEPEKAEAIFREITERFPDRPEGWMRLAVHVGASSSRKNEAKGLLLKATELADDDARPWVALAEFSSLAGEYAEAEAAWRSATEVDPDASELWRMFGRFYLRHEMLKNAEGAFTRAIEVDPEDARAWEQLGVTLIRQNDRAREAEKALREAMAKAPASCSPIHSLGKLYEREGRFAEADAQFRKALEVRPGCGCALSDLLSARSNYGRDVPDGEKLIGELISQYPNSSRGYLIRARYLRFAKDDLGAALKDAVHALSLDDANGSTLLQASEIAVDISSSTSEVRRRIFELIGIYSPCEHDLNFLAWRLNKTYGARISDTTLDVAKMASERDPISWQIKHTTATILVAAGRYDEAFLLFRELIEDVSAPELAELIDVVIDLAAGDLKSPPSLLDLIFELGKEGELEPLVVALKIVADQPVHVAQEVKDVADDIVERIRGVRSIH